MTRLRVIAAFAVLMSSAPHTVAAQQTLLFKTDPFAGSTALTTPGRQIVANEPFTTFDVATDVFAFETSVFSIGSTISFANGLVGSIPATGLNVIVVRDPAPLNAALAANLLANRITTSGPGIFLYFNSGLDLVRLVYSTDLSDETADLRILARLTNLNGPAGQAALANVSASNFRLVTVPEPSSIALTAAGLIGLTLRRRRSASARRD